MTAVQWTNQASVINQRNMYKNGKWLYDKNNTHGCTDKVWCERKAHQLWGHCPHCSEGCGGVHVNGACWHTAVASTPDCIHFCTQWGWPPPPRPRAPPIFSSGGEAGVIKKRPFQRLSQHQMPGWLQRVGRQTQEIQFLSSVQGGERKSREAFTSAAERTETMRSSHVLWQLWSV